MRRGQGVAIVRDGDTFLVIHDYATTEGGEITGTHCISTTNAREAVISYATAISERIIRDMLDSLEAEGYDRYTGEKHTTTT